MTSAATPNRDTFTFMTYNICYSRSAIDSPKGQFAKYSWENRRNDAFALIQQRATDVLFLQEVQNSHQAEVTKTLADYTWHFEPTLTRNGVCCNAIGIKKSFMPGVEQVKGAHNFNKGKLPIASKPITKEEATKQEAANHDQKEPSAAKQPGITTRDDTKEKVLRVVIGDLCLINIHWPMMEEDRLTMAAQLKECIPQDKKYRVLISGDFNSFPNYKGKEQLAAAEAVTETTCISDQAVSESTGKVATSSFTPYPYDPVPAKDLETPGKLDHILARGLELTDKTQAMVLDKALVTGQAFAPSDHYALIATLTNA